MKALDANSYGDILACNFCATNSTFDSPVVDLLATRCIKFSPFFKLAKLPDCVSSLKPDISSQSISPKENAMLKVARLLFVISVLLVSCLVSFAQTGTSSITGTIRDTNGAAVPGATVTAKNDATGVLSTQTTTESGLYSFSSLPVGNYTITVEKQGFKTLQKTNNTLQVGEPLT